MSVIGSDDWVTLKEDTHQYFDKNGDEYTSLSRVIDKFKIPFDRSISRRIAASNLPKNATPEQVDVEQQKILAQWDFKRDRSIDHGNFIHNELEKKIKTGQCDPAIEPVWEQIKEEVKYSYRIYSEVCFYDTDTMIAGTADMPVLRYNGRTTKIYDIYDFKTNFENGIEFNSVRVKDTGPNHLNKFLLDPISHLEDCNYNKYALQMSAYAYMAEKRYGAKIGRLSIIFVNKDYEVDFIPVNYLRNEVIAIFESVGKLKKLVPPNEKALKEAIEKPLAHYKEPFDPNNVKSNW